jgi:DNA repair exonuclease SbcCD nuclease subunit
MTRLLHTADSHVGYRQYHSPERRADFLAAFEAVVDDAVEGDVDAVVHAGDLFHDSRPDLEDLLGVLAALRRLDGAGVRFLAVVGNHESTRDVQWLDLFESLGLATRLGAAPVVVGDVALYGLDHVPPSRRDAMEYAFEDHDAARAALVAHGLFTPFAHADWETETVLSESTVAFDAVLLGDNHAPDTARVDGAWVTYPGSTERASTTEEDPRGYNLVEFDDDGVEVRRRSLDTRPFVYVDVDLAPGEGVERARERVRQHDLEDAVAVVEITGDGEAVPPADVEAAAEAEGALLARVTDRREVDDEADVSVSFADPDDAVRERVEELDLSGAALDVDETVRAGDVADSNVREAVTRRVEDLLDDGDLRASADAGDSADAEDPATDGDDADDAPAGDAGSDGAGADDGPPDEPGGATADSSGEDAAVPSGAEAGADEDGQTSMGEWE